MSQSRAQSSVVGVALLLGFTLLVVGATVTLGYGAISSSTDAVAVNQAENSLSQFDSAASEVALGSSDARRVDLGGTDRGVRVSDAGRLTVSVTNLSTGTPETLVDESLGAVVFSRGDRQVAYQGGGVWRDGQVVSPPEVHYTDGTLTLPVVTVHGAASGSDLLVRRGGDPVRVFPTGNHSNPFTGMRVNVTVSGPYYEGWATYFRERTDGTVSVDETERTTTLTLTNPPPQTPVEAGVISGAAGTTLQGGADIDGYDSREGDYVATKAETGRVSIAGNIALSNGGHLRGNLTVGGTATIDGGSTVTGAVHYGGSRPTVTGGGSVGTLSSGATPLQPASTAGAVRTMVDEARSRNDNGDVSVIDGTTLNCDDDPCTIPAGTYYLSGFNPDWHDVELNTTDGDVTLVVDGDFYLANGAKLSVTGPGRGDVYVTGDVDVTGGGRVSVPGDDATRFWLYPLPSSAVTFHNGVGYTGIVYGPGGGDQAGATITVESGVHVYGALVGNVRELANGAHVHYDHAAGASLPDTVSALEDPPASISYLHVSVEHLNVTDARAG
ncbi:hypothetical protein GCM10009037_00220 [Halarchaeum grantii]|uniref:DUF7305 domain-containing protein n=1 Tax=Halarchaeum grantii TaxID=1193105 RepID=A0A830F592_9EURY|nr:hypothetical protein [Halarchaeum grantii]GGL20878.1 hypothetical protein GCM10009037_00220 [Halarchaeum grantii]